MSGAIDKENDNQFWVDNPKGIPIKALFGTSGGLGKIGKRIAEEDVNSDGYLNKEEFRAIITHELSAEKDKKLFRTLFVTAGIALLVVLCAVLGLSFAAAELSKETKTSSDGVMYVPGSRDVEVKVANTEMEVIDGELVPRGGNASKPLKTAAAHIKKDLASCLPDSFFDEMQSFEVNNGLAYLKMDVWGFARTVRVNSVHGTVVTLVTAAGHVTIDGTMLEFASDGPADLFAAAGFQTSNRRLHGIYELTAMFNSIPEENFACFDSATDGPKPVLPANFAGQMKVYYPCDGGSVVDGGAGDMCGDADGLVDKTYSAGFQNVKSAVGTGSVYVNMDNGLHREDWSFPSRSKTLRFVGIQSQIPGKDLVNSNFMALGSADQPVAAGSTGYFCKSINVPGGSLPGSSDVTKLAAFEGYGTNEVTGSATRSFTYTEDIAASEGDEAKRLLIRIQDEKQTDGTYLVQSITVFELNSNKVMFSFEYVSVDEDFDFSAASAKALFVAPTGDKCLVDGHNAAGDEVVPLDSMITQANPLPKADEIRIQDIKHEAEFFEQVVPQGGSASSKPSSSSLDIADRRRRRLMGEDLLAAIEPTDSMAGQMGGDYGELSLDNHGRSLSGYSCCKFPNSNAAQVIQMNFDVVEFEIGAIPWPLVCYFKGQVNVKSEYFGLPPGLIVSGSIFIDWDPINGGCVEAGGSICAKLGVDKWGFSFTLFELCITVGGGYTSVNGCSRGYAFLSLGIGIGMGRTSGWFALGFELSGEVYVKFFFANKDCRRAVDLDVYFQVNVVVCVGFCGNNAWAWHVLGPEPGMKIADV